MTDILVRPRLMRVARADVDLADAPINPAWVLEGEPQARISEWAESEDGTTSHWTWECTPGRFRWYHDVDETVTFIEGRVTIALDGEEEFCLEVGDAAYFPAGNWTTWHVHETVRKHAVVRVPVPKAMRYAVKGFGRRTHRLR